MNNVKNKTSLRIGDHVYQSGDMRYTATVIDKGTLRRMFNKYNDHILNDDNFYYELVNDPMTPVVVVQYDDDDDYCLMPEEDMELVDENFAYKSYNKQLEEGRNVMIRKRRFYEEVELNDVQKIFDDYNRLIGIGVAPFVVNHIGDREDSISLPRFSREDVDTVKAAVDENDISLCDDVLDKIDNVLRVCEERKLYVDRVEKRISDLWKKFISNVKDLETDAIFVSDGKWHELDEADEYVPVFCAVEINERSLNHLKKLKDSIVDLF